jgi:hypothetical protein
MCSEGPVLEPTPSHVILTHDLTHYFFDIHLNIILHLCPAFKIACSSNFILVLHRFIHVPPACCMTLSFHKSWCDKLYYKLWQFFTSFRFCFSVRNVAQLLKYEYCLQQAASNRYVKTLSLLPKAHVVHIVTLLASTHGSSLLSLNIHTCTVCPSYPDVPLPSK